MLDSARTITLWLYTIALGIVVGAGLYEARVVVPQWLASPPSAWLETGLRFWVFVSTGPLTLLTLASLGLAWRAEPAYRNWWLASAVVVLLERVATFSYFIPTIYHLQNDAALPLAEVHRSLAAWAEVNTLRHAATVSAWLLALRALSRSSRTPSCVVD